MTLYEGRRTRERCLVLKRDETTEETEATLPARLDLWDHSPTGFEWGYGGSGPAQLALALLADALGDDEEALRLHQPFKWDVVSRLPEEGWRLRSEDVREAARRLQAEWEALRKEKAEQE